MSSTPTRMPEPGGIPPALVERARLSEILDAMTARICVVGADRRYRYANRAFAEFHRRPPEEIVGRSIQEVLGTEAADRVEPLARRALAVELYRKGISPQDAEPALAGVDDEAEEASAVELLRRRWRSGTGIDPQVQARRMIAMLGRKGYPSGLSSRLVRAMVDHDGAEPPPLVADED